MTPRELFESKCELPRFTQWDGFMYVPVGMCHPQSELQRIINSYNDKWIGFEAGYEAGREGK